MSTNRYTAPILSFFSAVILFGALVSFVHAASVPGDYIVRRNDANATSVTTTPFTASWDTAVASNGSSMTFSAPTTTVDAGKYLVLYGDHFNTDDTTNNRRVEIQSRILINGVATTTGAGQTYIRKEDGTAGDWQRAAIVSGASILDIPSDDTEIAIQYYRTDTASDAGGTVDRTAGWGGMTILTLDDAWNYARYGRNTSTSTADVFNDLVWDASIEEDVGFSRSNADITITNAGRYLVTYSIPIQSSSASDRTEYVSRMTLDGTEVEGSRVSTYIRGSESTQDGVLSYVGIIDVAASDVLNVELDRTDGTLANGTVLAGASIEILQLPSGNETIIAEATTGEMNPSTLTEFAWDTTAHIDTGAFTMTAGTDSYFEVDIDDDYLVFASHATDNGEVRTFSSGRFSVNDVISSTTAGGQFNRGSTADDAGYAFGGLLTGLTSGDDISLENIFIEVDHANQTLNHGAMSALRLGSLFNSSVSEWNATDWTTYDTITIESDNIDDDLTDFPVYVDLADLSSTFWSTTPTGSTTVGTDIRVTTNDGSPTELPRELVAASSTAQTGQLHFKANSISSTTDTVFRIYYNGNTDGDYATSSTYGAQNVWTNDYVGVWHLEEDPSGAGAVTLDSTANNFSGDPTSMASGDLVTGQIDNGYEFDGTSVERVGAADGVNPTNFSLSAWVQADSAGLGGAGRIHFDGTSDVASGTLSSVQGDGSLGLYAYYSGGDGYWQSPASEINTTDTFHIAVQHADLTNTSVNPTLYVNGSSTAVTENSAPSGTYQATASNVDLYFGNSSDGTDTFDGTLDEIRYSSTTRSSAWIKAEYENQSTTTDFYTVNATPPSIGITIEGMLYENDSITPVTQTATITAAVGTSTVSLHSTTTAADGSFSIQGIGTSTIGSWATTSAAGDNDSWRDVTYANGLFVAVGDSGDRVMTSPDGITWTARSAAGDNDTWGGITYGNGLFVAVGSFASGDRVMTSPDGITWTARSAAGDDDEWADVIYNNGLFVAVGGGFGDVVMTSPDGITWTARSAAGNNDEWSSITYGNGLFVAVSFSGDRVMTSPDGITWTVRSAAGDNDQWYGVAYGNNLFVAVSDVGDRVMTSPDGITWTVRSAAGDDDSWNDVVYANGLFVAAGSIPNDRVMTSPDGITWTVRSAADDDDQWKSVTYGNGLFVAVGDNGDSVMYADAGFGENTPITLFVDGNATTSSTTATTLTYGYNFNGGATTTMSEVDLHIDTLVLKNATNSAEIRLSDADFYDAYNAQLTDADDTDILFTATTSTTTVNADLYIESNTTVYAPQHLVIDGDFKQFGTFYAERGEVIADSTALDISSAELIGIFTNPSTNMTGLSVEDNGTRMYLARLGDATNEVRQYDLTTPWDITTASFVAGTSTVSDLQEDIAFKPDGTKYYIIQRGGNEINIHEYDLTTPWDITTASFVHSSTTQAFNFLSKGIDFSTDGTSMFTVSTNDRLHEFFLSTAWDISTLDYVGYTSISSITTEPESIRFTSDGMEFVVPDRTDDVIYRIGLDDPWNISTTTLLGVLDISDQTGQSAGIEIGNDGQYLYLVDYANTLETYQYKLDGPQFFAGTFTATSSLYDFTVNDTATVSPAYAMEIDNNYTNNGSAAGDYAGLIELIGSSTLSGDGNFGFVEVQGEASSTDASVTFTDLTIASGGTFEAPASGNLYVTGDYTNDGTFTHNNANTTFRGQGTYHNDLVYLGSSYAGDANPGGMFISPDGLNFYSVGSSGDVVDQYQLETPWDISVKTFLQSTTTTGQETHPRSMDFSPDGVFMYVAGIDSDNVNQYRLSTPWDVSTAAFLVATSTQGLVSNGLAFSSDGLRMYTTHDNGGDEVTQFALRTAWDISTAYVVHVDMFISETSPGDIAFSPDGRTVFVTGRNRDAVEQRSLPTPWDISVANNVSEYDISSIDDAPTDLFFSPDGTRFYVLGDENNQVYQFDVAALVGTSTGSTGAFSKLNITGGPLTFTGPASSTDTTSITSTATTTFQAGSTYTFEQIDFRGAGTSSPAILRSSSSTAEWILEVPGSQINVQYVDVQDSDASAVSGGVVASDSTNSGNNTNWFFTNSGNEWNAIDWSLYDIITIDSTNVDDDLTDFPVYVDLADLSSTFWSTTPSDAVFVGTDIRITNQSGTELPRELVAASSTLQTGELHFKADVISSTTDTVFRIYYNGTTTGDYAIDATYGAENVWTNDYLGVWHMGDINASEISDSTGLNSNGVKQAANDPIETSGKIGSAQDNTESGDYVNVGSSTSLANIFDGGGTVSYWVDMDTYANLSDHASFSQYMNKGNVWSIQSNDTTRQFEFVHGFNTQAGLWTIGDVVILNQPQFVNFVYDSSSSANDPSIYLDGQSKTVTETTAPSGTSQNDTSSDMILMNNEVYTRTLDGWMDEVRFASTTRSAAWIKAEYTNQSTTTDFYTIGGIATGTVRILGTLYENNGIEPITDGKAVVAAVGTSNPSLHTATSTDNGEFSITIETTPTIGTWATTSAAGDDDEWDAVAYGNGMFVVVGPTGDRIMTSPDGVNWTVQTAAGNDDAWHGIAYGNGTFVAVGSTTGSSDVVMTSPDGITWTTQTAAGDDDGWRGLTYGNGLFVAVGYGNNGGGSVNHRVMTSPDGITWTPHSADGNDDLWNSVIYGNGMFVAVGSSGNRVLTSSDGITWTGRSVLGNDDAWIDVTYGNGLFVAVNLAFTSDEAVMISSDGITWASTTAAGDDDAWLSVTYANGHFIAAGDGAIGDTVMTSPDGITWTTQTAAGDDDNWYDITYGNGRLVSVGITGDRVMYADAGFGENTPITLFVDENDVYSTSSATTLTYGINSTSSGLLTLEVDLREDTVILQKENGDQSIYLSDADVYDSSNDTDVLFTATTSTTTLDADVYIGASTTVFAPQNLIVRGDMTLDGTYEAERGELIADSELWDLSRRDEVYAESSGIGSPEAMAFNNDGTKFYLIPADDVIYEYSLSEPYYVPSKVATGVSSSTNAIDSTAEAMFFKPDGTKLYIAGNQNDNIYEYDLTTAWDIATLTYVQSTTTLGGPGGVTLSPDGTKMLVVRSNGYMHEYDLSVAWDVSTAAYVQASSYMAEIPRHESYFNEDGSEMINVGQNGNRLEIFTFSTPWDVSTMVKDTSRTRTGFSAASNIGALLVDPLGRYATFGYSGGNTIGVYELDQPQKLYGDFTSTSTLYDFTVGEHERLFNYADIEVENDFKVNGEVRYGGPDIELTGTSGELQGDGLFGNVLVSGTYTTASSAATVANLTATSGASFTAPATSLTIEGNFANSGTVTHSGSTTVSGIDRFNVNNATQLDSFFGGQTSMPLSLAFNDSGTKAYIVGQGSVYGYDLTTPWDLTTIAYNSESFSIATEEPGTDDATGITFNPEGTILYMVGVGSDEVHMYYLSTAWDVSTAVVANKTLDVSAQDGLPRDIAFSADGSRLYMLGSTTADVFTYELVVPWDVSTGSYNSESKDLSPEDISPRGLNFTPDGRQMFFIGYDDRLIHVYDLSTPWDVTTAAPDNNQSFDAEWADIETMYVSPEGDRIYIISLFNIYEYALGYGASYSGNMVGPNAFNEISVAGDMLLTDSASTSDVTVSTSSSLAVTADFFDIAGDFEQNGTFTNSVGTTIVTGDTNTTGTTTISSGGMMFSGSYTNTGTTIFGTGSTTFNIFDNQGAMTFGAGTTTFNANGTSTGDIGATESTLIFNRDFVASSSGSLVNTSGSITFGGTEPQTITFATSTLVSSTDFETVLFPPTGWETGGDTAWSRATTTTSGGSVGAAVSGAMAETGGTSWIQTTTTVSASSTLVFDYKVSSEAGFDFLVVCINQATCGSSETAGSNDFEVAGDVDWTSGSLELGPGENVIRFAYVKDTSVSELQDEAYIDNILISTGAGRVFLNDVAITNTSGTGSSSQSVVFTSPLSIAGTFSMEASTSAAFPANATSTFENIDLQGGGTDSPVWLRSTNPGTEWYLDVPGTQIAVDFVNVQDSNATSTSGGISATNSTDSGNNTNWSFVAGSVREWNATDWTLYDTITIHHENIDEPLTDFPVYVDLADLSAAFWSNVSDGGGDIRITTDEVNPQEIPREVVSASTTLEIGELHFKADYISEVIDTSYRIYYNGTTTGDYSTNQTYGAENVWTNEYVGVWHMDDDPSSDGTLFDSTSLVNNGTASGTMTATDVQTGRLGSALRFDGSNDFVFVDNSSSLDLINNGDWSMSVWSDWDPDSYDMQIFQQEDGGGNGRLTLAIDGDDASCVGNNEFRSFQGGSTSCSGQTTLDTWNYVVIQGIENASNDTIEYYSNGVAGATSSHSFETNDGGSWRFGADKNNPATSLYDGDLDEIRFASTNRSAAWIKAEYYNQSTTTDFYTLTTGTGSSTIANHDAGQVSDGFDFQNKTNEALFAFKITPESGTATVTRTELTISGWNQKRLDVSDFSNIRLYRDHDDDAAYDASDEQVGGTGVISFLDQNTQLGTVVFSDDYLSTTSQNYVVVADWSVPARGSHMTLSLQPNGLTMFDNDGGVSVTGSVDQIQHSRNNKGGGGGSAAQVGGAPPVGDGDVGGGTNDGGELIGNDPDFFWPTANSGSWTNPANAYDQTDGTYATNGSSPANHEFTNYNDSVPGGDTIEGIEVKLEVSYTGTSQTFDVALSWDGGTSWTSVKTTASIGNTDTVVTLGGSGDTWGRSWTSGEFSNANFSVRITGNGAALNNTAQLDAIQVKVYHQASGGGSGGGGAI